MRSTSTSGWWDRISTDAVRWQAAADGMVIGPWHLPATIEGLRFRMEHALRVIDRGVISVAASAAWIILSSMSGKRLSWHWQSIRRPTWPLMAPPASS
jgi:hypothetical protein